jgi:hypothetical protein
MKRQLSLAPPGNADAVIAQTYEQADGGTDRRGDAHSPSHPLGGGAIGPSPSLCMPWPPTRAGGLNLESLHAMMEGRRRPSDSD